MRKTIIALTAASALALGACSSTSSDAQPRSPSTAEAAPPPALTDAGVDDGPADAAVALPLLTVPAGALDGFHAALDRAAAKDPGGRALVLVFGDSHTAGDQLTGLLRRQLGARFGKGGRGVVLAGRPPVRHYYVREVGYASTGKWEAELVGARGATPPYGLAGVRAHADRKTAEAWVETCGSCSTREVDRFDVFYLRTRASGRLAFRVDSGRWQKIPTRLAASAPTESCPWITR